MGISDILAELDRLKRLGMSRGRDMVTNTGDYLTQLGDNMQNMQMGREAVAAGGGLGYRDIPKEEQTRRMTEGALDTVSGGLGTLIGKGARGFNQVAANKAAGLAQKGASAKDIWFDVPQNFVLPTGRVVQEIDDSTAKIAAPWLPDMAKLRGEAQEATDAFTWAKMMRDEGKMPPEEFDKYLRRRLQAENAVKTPPRQDVPNMPLSQFLIHPELYDNYPSLAKMDLAINPHTRGAFHSPDQGLISIGTKDAEDAQSLLGVTGHEVGHEIQTVEGLPVGGGPEMFSKHFGMKRQLQNQLLADQAAGRDLSGLKAQFAALKQSPFDIAKSEYDAYRRLFGEQLSDATQFRINKDLNWRRDNFFGDDFTAPVEKTLWRNSQGMIYPAPLQMPSLGGYGGQKRTHSTQPMPDTLNMEWIRRYGGL